jgi:hypothetical protein
MPEADYVKWHHNTDVTLHHGVAHTIGWRRNHSLYTKYAVQYLVFMDFGGNDVGKSTHPSTHAIPYDVCECVWYSMELCFCVSLLPILSTLQ